MPAQLDTRGEAFGDRLRSLRERAGLTQEELANRAGLTPNAVSALERGTRTRPYPHTVREGIALSEQNHDLRTRQTLGESGYADAMETGRGFDVSDIVQFALSRSSTA